MEVKFLPALFGAAVAFGVSRKIRGFNRLHRLLGGGRIKWSNARGLVMALDPSEYIDGFIIRNGYYEEEVLDCLLGLIRHNDVIWDIGANTGIHSMTIAALYPHCKVYLFEPNPRLHDVLAWQKANNVLSALKVLPVALSDQSGNAELFLYPGNCGMSSLIDWSRSAKHCVPVKVERADSLVEANWVPQPNVIKLDVEGGELSVLRGFGSIIDSPDLRAIVSEDSRANRSPVKDLLRHSLFEISPLLRRNEKSSHNLENYLALKHSS